MLYNPNWNPISLDSLIAWLETQPADDEYCYGSNSGCLIAQFLTSKGYPKVCVGGASCHYSDTHVVLLKLPKEFYEISVNLPRTFGAALARAKAAV